MTDSLCEWLHTLGTGATRWIMRYTSKDCLMNYHLLIKLLLAFWHWRFPGEFYPFKNLSRLVNTNSRCEFALIVIIVTSQTTYENQCQNEAVSKVSKQFVNHGNSEQTFLIGDTMYKTIRFSLLPYSLNYSSLKVTEVIRAVL